MRFVLFGATGDLAQKKILPALESLKVRGADIDIVQVSRRSAVAVDVEAGTGYDALEKLLGTEPAMVYISLAPRLHPRVVEALGERGLLCRGKTKLLIEKPFGTDLSSAIALDALIWRYLDESDIYRVDHYLCKAAVQDAMDGNNDKNGKAACGPAASIRVRLFEEKGIDGRGASYDGVGAFRDVGQNHLLEMTAVALAACRLPDPKGATGGEWQAARAEILRKLVPPENTCIDFRRGQYEGYLSESGVAPGSTTETAFRVVTMVDGIHIALEAGKKMGSSEASILVSYKDGTEARFDLRAGRDAYERVIEAALQGSRREFVGREEVLALWSYADRASACWNTVPLETYGKDRPFLIQ
jgi:glucose-6-phosphate 1-dehydrogenase